MGYVDSNYMAKIGLPTCHLLMPILVFNIDGSRNKAGSVTHMADVLIRFQGHSEHCQFSVTCLGKQNMILGYRWLQKHNLDVDWVNGKVQMMWCPPPCSAHSEEHRKCQNAKSTCSGPFPKAEELKEPPDEVPDKEDADFIHFLSKGPDVDPAELSQMCAEVGHDNQNLSRGRLQ